MLKEARIEKVSMGDFIRLVLAAVGAPFMSLELKKQLYHILTQELQPYAKQPMFSMADVQIIWPKIMAMMRKQKIELPPFQDHNVQDIVKQVVESLHGAYGHGVGSGPEQIDEMARQTIRRMKGKD
jgi:hypothetical protein